MGHFTKARREVGRDEDLNAEVGTGNVEFLPVLRTNGLSFLPFTVYRLRFQRLERFERFDQLTQYAPRFALWTSRVCDLKSYLSAG
jgi:hypothetical protein